MFDIYILEKQLEDALENKNCEKLTLKKNPNRNRYAFNYNKKNKSKRKGTAYSMNACVTTCFYCMKKGHTSNKCNIKHFGVPNRKYSWVPVVR